MGYAAKTPEGQPLPIHVAPPTAPDITFPTALPPASSVLQMVQRISHISPKSGAEALHALRMAFPDSPLTLRVAALNMLMRRNGASPHIPNPHSPK
jgi:hypothetical protein